MASRTGWLLGLDRLSMTTMSPGASAGTRTCLTDSRKPSPWMEPSRSWGAVTPLRACKPVGGWLPIEVGFGLTERGWAGAEAGMACEVGGGAGARRDHGD